MCIRDRYTPAHTSSIINMNVRHEVDRIVSNKGNQAEGMPAPQIAYKEQKHLPHLKDRRVYQSSQIFVEEMYEPVEQNSMAQGIRNSPGTKPPQSESKNTEHTNLSPDFVPRPNVIPGENTVKGIQYSAKSRLPQSAKCPSATTRHFSTDEGNSIPRMFRCSAQCVLSDGKSFLDSTSLPLGAIVQPFAELSEFEVPVPLSIHGADDLLRCVRCGAYVNPNFVFTDAGTNAHCNICGGITPLHSQLFSTEDTRPHPELTHGAYDFIAPLLLAGKKVTGHNLILLIECTANAVNFGTQS
eukprot:TRINITY_DN11624_c0_g3_i5.p2 TRINITY_DN11624_c0_g3~~TRINITY_DN11624_c0_g3_i5.p2  ORF type:complete len:298 (-),score=27.72 TRINITY_DN11624_c0_g3_i5:1675-2568(-)